VEVSILVTCVGSLGILLITNVMLMLATVILVAFPQIALFLPNMAMGGS
jgi:hypothetical protein